MHSAEVIDIYILLTKVTSLIEQLAKNMRKRSGLIHLICIKQ